VLPPTCDDEPLGPSEWKEPGSLDDVDEESAGDKDPCCPEELEILPS